MDIEKQRWRKENPPGNEGLSQIFQVQSGNPQKQKSDATEEEHDVEAFPGGTIESRTKPEGALKDQLNAQRQRSHQVQG